MQKRGKFQYKPQAALDKAQAALEFLITYGWAILIVLAIIAGLYSFDFFRVDKILPEKCFLSAGIECVDYSVGTSKVTLVLRNTIGADMTIDQIDIIKEDGSSCSNTQPALLKDDEKKIITIANCDVGNDGSTLEADIKITYRLQASPHLISGNIRAKIVEGATTTSLTTCQNAENDGLCDGLELLFGEGYKAACCSEHGLCC